MKTILVLTDFSPAAKAAADAGLAIARVLEADVVLLNSYHLPQVILTELPGKDYVELEVESKKKLEKEQDRLLKIIDSREWTKKTEVKIINSIAPLSEVLYDIQQHHKILLTVMGRHKRSRNSFLFANHIHVAISNSNCPLLIMTALKFNFPGLCANFASDLDPKDLPLISMLYQLAKTFRSTLSVSHVLDDSGFIADFNAEDRLDAFSLALKAEAFNGVRLHVLEGGSIVAEEKKLLRQSGFDLLIVVHRRHLLLQELFHDSHCKAFIKNQTTPILVMPEDWDGNFCLEKLEKSKILRHQRLQIMEQDEQDHHYKKTC